MTPPSFGDSATFGCMLVADPDYVLALYPYPYHTITVRTYHFYITSDSSRLTRRARPLARLTGHCVAGGRYDRTVITGINLLLARCSLRTALTMTSGAPFVIVFNGGRDSHLARRLMTIYSGGSIIRSLSSKKVYHAF